MDRQVKRYYQLKQKQKECEQELQQLRREIMDHCKEHGLTEAEFGTYKVKIVNQERKEYDDNKVYEALPDPHIWRMISRADAGKIAGMISVNVLSEQALKDTFLIRTVSSLLVEKK